MTTTFHNSSLRSNIIRNPPPPVPSDLSGDLIQTHYPSRAIKKAVDLAHMPASIIDGYTANKKTMVQNMFNAKNLNENLNFKNTYYATERGDLANKEANTVYGYDKVYPKQTVDGELKAEYTTKAWKSMHVKSQKKVKDALRETTENVAKIREAEAQALAEEQAKHEKDVKKQFKKVQNLIGVMVGTVSPKATIGSSGHSKSMLDKRKSRVEEDSEENILEKIERDANDEEKILNNRANIRSVMGARSKENQERLQAEREAQERMAAMEEAEKRRIERMEEKRVEKFLDLQKLSKTWRIPDKAKLKEVVRNEIMKEIMKEEERKNFREIAQNMKKQHQAEKEKSLIKKPTKPKIEPPKAFSPSKKKPQPKKETKKYVFSPEKIHKLPAETQADYTTRFNFTVMALPQQKQSLDPVEQHLIAKRFQEMIVRNGVEKNGKIVLEGRK